MAGGVWRRYLSSCFSFIIKAVNVGELELQVFAEENRFVATSCRVSRTKSAKCYFLIILCKAVNQGDFELQGEGWLERGAAAELLVLTFIFRLLRYRLGVRQFRVARGVLLLVHFV